MLINFSQVFAARNTAVRSVKTLQLFFGLALRWARAGSPYRNASPLHQSHCTHWAAQRSLFCKGHHRAGDSHVPDQSAIQSEVASAVKKWNTNFDQFASTL